MEKVSEKVFIRVVPKEYDLVRYSDKKAKESLADHQYFIGSSLKGDDVLRGLDVIDSATGEDEEKKFLPSILGVNPNSEAWHKATKDFWSNISKRVPNGTVGLELEIGFEYADKYIAENVQKEIEKLIDNKTIENLTKEDMISLCKEKQKKGNPINLENYILFRYCLVYGKVANNITTIYNSPKIVFYIYFSNLENKKKLSERSLKQKARLKIDAIEEDTFKVNSILRIFEKTISENVIENLTVLDELVNTRPQEVINLIDDTDFEIKAYIENCIVMQLLRRIPLTGQIYYGETDLIGSNLNEAVAFFKDVNNPRKSQIITNIKSAYSINSQKIIKPVKTNVLSELQRKMKDGSVNNLSNIAENGTINPFSELKSLNKDNIEDKKNPFS